MRPSRVRSLVADSLSEAQGRSGNQVDAIETVRAIGLGTDVRFEGPSLTGGALVVGEAVIHLAAFHLPETKTRIVRRPRTRRTDMDDQVF
jgi:hypothetical protein